ncbi:MAG: dockerin type I domain-containing protein [Candidatus Pacearchaeota archaeon]
MRKKGVSNIIVVLLLLMIVIILMIIVFNVVNITLKKTTDQIDISNLFSNPEMEQATLIQGLRVESWDWKGVNDDLQVYVIYDAQYGENVTKVRFNITTSTTNCFIEMNTNPQMAPGDTQDFLILESSSPCVANAVAVSVEAVIEVIPPVVISNDDWCKGADTNKDGRVTAIDLLAIRANWLKTNCTLDFDSNDWCKGADTNKDGRVTAIDLLAIRKNWLRTDCTKITSWCDGADTNKDGRVTAIDLLAIRKNWLQKSCNGFVTPYCNGADTNKDGRVTALDLLMVRKYWLNSTCTCQGGNLIKNNEFKKWINYIGGNQLPRDWIYILDENYGNLSQISRDENSAVLRVGNNPFNPSVDLKQSFELKSDKVYSVSFKLVIENGLSKQLPDDRLSVMLGCNKIDLDSKILSSGTKTVSNKIIQSPYICDDSSLSFSLNLDSAHNVVGDNSYYQIKISDVQLIELGCEKNDSETALPEINYITHCGITLESNKKYALKSDLNANGLTAPCITIDGSIVKNITLDGRHHTIKGDSNVAGVYINGGLDVSDITIYDLDIDMGEGEGGIGIYLARGRYCNIFNCKLDNQNIGLRIGGDTDNKVGDHNNIYDIESINNTRGLYVWGGANNFIQGYFSGNSQYDSYFSFSGLWTDGNNQFINLDESANNYLESSKVEIYGTYQAKILNKASKPIKGAQVEIIDSETNEGVAFLESDNQGYTSFGNIVDYTQIYNSKTYKNYKIIIIHPCYPPKEFNYNTITNPALFEFQTITIGDSDKEWTWDMESNCHLKNLDYNSGNINVMGQGGYMIISSNITSTHFDINSSNKWKIIAQQNSKIKLL